MPGSETGGGVKARGAWGGFVHHSRHLHRRPRHTLAALIAILLFFLLPHELRLPTRLLIAFDGGAVFFLAAIWIMMARATEGGMRRRAEAEEPGRLAVLVFAVLLAAAILLAIVFQLHGLKDVPPARLPAHVGLAVATILLTWFFMNTQFALHYAYGHFDGTRHKSAGATTGGLVFPGGGTPDYWDFLYFSFVIGMTFQVSDVAIESRRLRRVALGHGALAFFFNVVILALTINIVAGLL